MTQISFQDRSISRRENPGWLKALTLTERLNGLPRPTVEVTNEKARRKLQRWKEQGPFNKAGYFDRRLETDGLAEATLLYLLAEPLEALQTRTEKMPEWQQALVAPFEDRENSGPLAGLEPEITQNFNIPLALVPLKPLILSGLARLQAYIGELSRKYANLPFEPGEVSTLFLDSLLEQLTSRLNRVLALEVNVARLQGRLQGDTPQARFADFIEQLVREDKILALLEEYPVLARQLGIMVANWVNFTQEFLTHLTEDWPLIQLKFSPNSNPGKLVAVKTGNGDSHRGGRSVVKVAFESGFKLIYKPKSLAVELHFQELLGWLNDHGAKPSFRVLQILERENHGWEEFVVAASSSNKAEIGRFYQRQGAYLALLYALDATDIHQENLIAAGEHPVLVDLEALFHPRLNDAGPDQAWQAATQRMNYSVMRIGLLPNRIFTQAKGQGFDISGLGSKPGQLTPKPVAQWEGSGTDQFRMVRQQIEIPDAENLPRLDGKPVNILDYTPAIISGFEGLYHLLLKYRAELLAGPLQAFREDEVRVILRNTSTYFKLLQQSFHPDFLSDGLDRDRFFDHLWASIDLQPYLARTIPSERADLQAGDVPVFNIRAASRSIYDSRGLVIPDFLNESPFEAVIQRLEQLGEDDLTWQSWFIKASLASVDRPESFQSGVKPVHLANPAPPAPAEFLAAALKIGDTLARQALVQGENVNWVGLSLINDTAWSIQPSGLDLYSGTPGIALFLAHLGRISGQTRFTDLARKALNTIRQEVKQFKPADLPVGAFEGWGGLIYLYTHLGHLWAEPSLYREAFDLAGRLPELLEKDANLDIIGGAAGSLLSLLSLYKVFPHPQLLEIARLAGEHLLEKASKRPTGLAWPSGLNPEIHLAGFSHGAAGMAFSLLSLAQVSGDDRFKTAALAAIDYERSLFSSEHRNWPDLREDATGYITTWCHGAAGIALGRLASLPFLDDPALLAEIEAGLATTLKEGFGFNHSLCHGDLGNLEPFLLANQTFQGTETADRLNSISRMVLDSLAKEGPVSGIPMQVECPGLMTGLAGIGYGLLRLAKPRQVPSVLLLAPPA
jgi:type 2 lantibiotic biosynthesis protein LanM